MIEVLIRLRLHSENGEETVMANGDDWMDDIINARRKELDAQRIQQETALNERKRIDAQLDSFWVIFCDALKAAANTFNMKSNEQVLSAEREGDHLTITNGNGGAVAIGLVRELHRIDVGYIPPLHPPHSGQTVTSKTFLVAEQGNQLVLKSQTSGRTTGLSVHLDAAVKDILADFMKASVR